MDARLLTILAFGLAMASLALVGGLLAVLPRSRLQQALPALLAFSAGALLGGALLFMLPKALAGAAGTVPVLRSVLAGFALMFALDLVLEWHHCRQPPTTRLRPLGPLLLVADGLHNLLGGLAVGALFVVDVRAGIAAWIAAAFHELPQELGDFGALVHAGFSRRRALLWNFVAALAFPVGGVVAWALGERPGLELLVALGAGNFVYIAAADLVPEIKRTERLPALLLRLAAFGAGLALLEFARSATA